MTLADLVAQARGHQDVELTLSLAVRSAIEESSRRLARSAEDGGVYGLTSGVGALRDVPVAAAGEGSPPEHALGLWRSHAADFGPELNDADARITMLVRLRQLAAGPTGVSLHLTEALERAVLSGAVPVLRGHGSIGTGDLSVLAQLALTLIGEGVWRSGWVRARPASQRRTPCPSSAANAMTAGVGALVHQDLSGLLAASERVAALSFLALRGSTQAYDERIFARRADPAVAESAGRLRQLLVGAPRRGDRV